MFNILEIPENAAEIIEQLGTKSKFWFTRDGQKWLFKEGRPGTGENWAEKVAAELCVLLGLPHAGYEFARFQDKYGIATPSFVQENDRLILGNELLAKVVQDYEECRKYHQSQYTLRRVLAVLKYKFIFTPMGWDVNPGILNALDVFVGYLMLDALIANQDRHHENWGLVVTSEPKIHLTPTFDHASSLGRNESDEIRNEILATRDARRHITSYVKKARSAFYLTPTANKRMTTIEAFEEAVKFSHAAGKVWLENLRNLNLEDVKAIFDRVPQDLITHTAVEFAMKIIELNKQRLLELEKD